MYLRVLGFRALGFRVWGLGFRVPREPNLPLKEGSIYLK